MNDPQLKFQIEHRLTKLINEYNTVLENMQIGITSVMESCIESHQFNVEHSIPPSKQFEPIIQKHCLLKLVLEKEKDVISSMKHSSETELLTVFMKQLNEFETKMNASPSTYLKQSQEYAQHSQKVSNIIHSGDVVSDDDNDADLIIGEQVISLICPLTQLRMDVAWKSKKCGHSYSSEIVRMTKKGRVECPVAGCVHYVSLADLEKNKALQQKLNLEELTQAHKEFSENEDYEMVDV